MRNDGWTVLLLVASIALSSGAALAHSAVEPVAQDWDEARQRYAMLMRRVTEQQAKQAQIVFIGDSITQFWESEGAAVWSKRIAPRRALNLGVSGDMTQHVLWRLEQGAVAGLDPKLVVVMIGTNNVGHGGSTVPQVAEGVTAVVEKIRERLPRARVLLLGIFPRDENPGVTRGTVLQINQMLQHLDDGRNVFWLDIGARFIAPDGTIPSRLMPDFLHLSSSGYEVWADAIEAKIEALIAE